MKARHFTAIVCSLMVVFLAACASSTAMIKSAGPATAKPNEATVIFMRSSFVGSAVAASVFDVSQPGTRFVGVVDNGTKLAYVVSAGDHTFMVVSEAADFMKATLLPGKTYYALITPRMGAWKARFSFRPLRQPDLAGVDFADWDKNTQWVETGAEAVAWADRNAADVADKRARYWKEWSSKDIDQRNSQTLNAADGR